jgi:predicted nucleic acid-binding protein
MQADRPAQQSSFIATRQRPSQGMLDTSVLILRRWVNPDELPDEMAISAVTLAELSAGPHQVRPDHEQADYDEHAERGRRLNVLQRAEHEFDPIPFGSEAARAYGQVAAAVIGAGRSPRRRTADLMIASTAIAAGLPLYTTNPDDFAGLDDLLVVVPVTCPRVHRERVRP